jgi:hypothetical protein
MFSYWAVLAMNWTDLCRAVDGNMEDSKAKVMLIEPADDKRISSEVDVLTPTVMRLI